MVRKKAQLKIQQMAFMLLAVVLFFVLVGLFWLMFQSKDLKKESTYLKENQAAIMAGFISQSSEFACAGESGAYCIDADRMIVLENKTAYKEYWPVSYIKIIKVYPKQEKEIICNRINYPDCNVFNVYENKKIESRSFIGSFAALCRNDKVEGYAVKICELGKINIGYEVR